MSEISNSQIYVTGLPFSATETEISECFKQHGETENVKIIKYDDGRSKGRAFVDFKTEEFADSVFENRKNIQLSGRKLFLDFTGTKSVFGKKLFVKGLPYFATDDEIKSLDVFKKVESIETLKFECGKSKGCGYSSLENTFQERHTIVILLFDFCFLVNHHFFLIFPTFFI